jgi:hypothetical protein
LAARQAHNLEVVGSSPTPATKSLGSSVVEQRTENPCVVSSILTRGTELGLLGLLRPLGLLGYKKNYLKDLKDPNNPNNLNSPGCGPVG